MAVPELDVFVLNVAITMMLAVALPLARDWAGWRQAEPLEQRRRATWTTAAAVIGWLAVWGGLAAAGVLDHWDMTPPPVMPALVIALFVVVACARSSFGRCLAEGLPLWALVGFQAFRIPVEIMLYRAYAQGVIGVQMTWSGRNFDIITGVLALGLGLWMWRRDELLPIPYGVIRVWNQLGIVLLINIVIVAIMSMPTPMRMFDGPPNVWIASFPYVWLPTVMVMAALFGHLLVLRRLRSIALASAE